MGWTIRAHEPDQRPTEWFFRAIEVGSDYSEEGPNIGVYVAYDAEGEHAAALALAERIACFMTPPDLDGARVFFCHDCGAGMAAWDTAGHDCP